MQFKKSEIVLGLRDSERMDDSNAGKGEDRHTVLFSNMV
jgi:hypothetical protein